MNRRSTFFGIIAGNRHGVYLVCLSHLKCGLQTGEHCVAVDASRGLILDSIETCPIKLAAEMLQMYGGPNAPILELAEILQLVIKIIERRP